MPVWSYLFECLTSALGEALTFWHEGLRITPVGIRSIQRHSENALGLMTGRTFDSVVIKRMLCTRTVVFYVQKESLDIGNEKIAVLLPQQRT